MAIMITDECINCGACEPECPNNAIYEGGAEWAFSDGTTVKGSISMDGEMVDVSKRFAPMSRISRRTTMCSGMPCRLLRG